jgi:hypothetical protein
MPLGKQGRTYTRLVPVGQRGPRRYEVAEVQSNMMRPPVVALPTFRLMFQSASAITAWRCVTADVTTIHSAGHTFHQAAKAFI